MAISNVTGNIPLWEGQGLCERYYGDLRESRRDCARAASLLRGGEEELPFYVNTASGPQVLPLDVKYGNCMIQIEAAGPELPEIIYIAPDRLVSMADWVLNTCVRSPGGAIGGFITSDLSALEDYITTPGITLDDRYPQSTAFYTVSMTTIVPDWLSPGNFEPEMAYLLAKSALDAEQIASAPNLKRELVRRSQRFFDQAREMHPRGIRTPWWNKPQRLGNSAQNSTVALNLPGGDSNHTGVVTSR